VSLDGPLSEEINAFLVDPAADVNRIVEDRLMISKLRDTILSLRKDEQLLIIQYFYEEMTESRIAEMYGVTQQAISHRLKMLCRRLKEKLS
jgi:RNA polymerase sigma factor (sigma-70 family)